LSGPTSDVAVPLRWADADAYGHVHHAVYLSLVEHARIIWLLRALESDAATIWDHATVHLTIDYRSELMVEHGEVVCSFRVTEAGTTSIRLIEQMRAPDGTVVADLETVVAAWEPAEHRTRPLTSAERAALLGH
jgi:acyl-CoA thioester hydrolase